MEKKTFNNLNLDVYEETLPNGLRIFLCPMSRHEVAAQMTVLFGGSVLEFELNGKNIKVPAGIAHFLEHKMFEKEDGTDPIRISIMNQPVLTPMPLHRLISQPTILKVVMISLKTYKIS